MEQELKWENALITQATEAQKSFECEESIISEDHALIKLAYEQCEKITYDNSRTFFMASNLLPEAKKRGARALYAFCRVSDDLVDRPEINASHKSLEDWRARTINTQPASDDMIAYAWDHTSRHFCIPWAFAEQLIDGVAMDLRKPSYQTIDELANYCYGVACTVGLMSMHIIGFESEDAVPYAIRLGVVFLRQHTGAQLSCREANGLDLQVGQFLFRQFEIIHDLFVFQRCVNHHRFLGHSSACQGQNHRQTGE